VWLFLLLLVSILLGLLLLLGAYVANQSGGVLLGFRELSREHIVLIKETGDQLGFVSQVYTQNLSFTREGLYILGDVITVQGELAEVLILTSH
jgi:hypothetical protein